jgi:hypothetical protein
MTTVAYNLKDWSFCPVSLWVRLHDDSHYTFLRQNRDGEHYQDTKQISIVLEDEFTEIFDSMLKGVLENLDEDGFADESIDVLSRDMDAIGKLREMVWTEDGWFVVRRITYPARGVGLLDFVHLGVVMQALHEVDFAIAGAIVIGPDPAAPSTEIERVIWWDDNTRADLFKKFAEVQAIIDGQYKPPTGYWSKCPKCPVTQCYAQDDYEALKAPRDGVIREITL